MRKINSLTYILFLFIFPSSCINEDFSDCFVNNGIQVRVVTLNDPAYDPIHPSEVQVIKLYVFDSDDILLEIRQTELNKIEHLNYQQELKITAFANTNGGQTLKEPIKGSHKNEGMLSLKSISSLENLNIHQTTDDLMWGEIGDISVKPTKVTNTIYDLPIRRITPGVFIRVYGFEKYAEQMGWDKNVSLVFTARHNIYNFFGSSQEANFDVYYQPAIEPANTLADDIYECPGITTGQKFFNVFACDEGVSVAIHFYNGNKRIYTCTTDEADNILKVYNGKMSVFEIYFKADPLPGEDGYVQVKVTEPQWGNIPPIDKEF